jgi:RNA polymerase sigma factor (sigma-70 family)
MDICDRRADRAGPEAPGHEAGASCISALPVGRSLVRGCSLADAITSRSRGSRTGRRALHRVSGTGLPVPRRVLGDGDDAEDQTQETFLRALGAPYTPDGRERAWLFQIARNLARDRGRAAARRSVSLAQLEVARGSGDVSIALEIDAALGSLTPEDRKVFLLKEVGGLSYAEIAQACELTPDAREHPR